MCFGCGLKCQSVMLGAALRESYQEFAVEAEIDQSEAGAEPMVVLGQSAVAHLVEAEDAFQDMKRMLDLGPHARLTFILLLL